MIKSRNFSPTKCENTWEKDGLGWAPGQEKKFEGKRTREAIRNYRNNYDRIFRKKGDRK